MWRWESIRRENKSSTVATAIREYERIRENTRLARRLVEKTTGRNRLSTRKWYLPVV
jgi:hypothetical protein